MAGVLGARVPNTAPSAGAGGGGGTSRQSVMPSARGRRCRWRSVRRARGFDVPADGAVDTEAAGDVAGDVVEGVRSSRGSPPGAMLGIFPPPSKLGSPLGAVLGIFPPPSELGSPPPGPPFPLLPRLLPLAALLATALPVLATALTTALPTLVTAPAGEPNSALATPLAMPALAATAGGSAQFVKCSA